MNLNKRLVKYDNVSLAVKRFFKSLKNTSSKNGTEFEWQKIDWWKIFEKLISIDQEIGDVQLESFSLHFQVSKVTYIDVVYRCWLQMFWPNMLATSLKLNKTSKFSFPFLISDWGHFEKMTSGLSWPYQKKRNLILGAVLGKIFWISGSYKGEIAD